MKTKEEYLKDIRHCPKCDGVNINTRRPLARTDVNTVYHTVSCMNPNCEAIWTDVFTVTDVLGLV